ncbi:hypothetical protein KKC45_02675 [Patescibacteria group bacterium]|nr:hypothetical protein [Patescibacteria group bacterium]
MSKKLLFVNIGEESPRTFIIPIILKNPELGKKIEEILARPKPSNPGRIVFTIIDLKEDISLVGVKATVLEDVSPEEYLKYLEKVWIDKA